MGTLRFVGRVVRGLIAAAALVALVAGLPWALWHYIGWPLPSHVPTWAEIHDVLLGPMTTTFLLDFLACAIWIVWAAFTLDVLRCTIEMARDLARGGFDTARLPDFSAAGPIHTLAGVLVGAILLSVLGNQPAPAPAASLSAALGGGAHVVATAPAGQHPTPATDVILRDAVFATPTSAAGATAVTAPTHPVSVVVLAPSNGVHDSLWRIAQRTLGDGARWPEIFDLNKGKPQPGGRSFTQPSLIFPGEELALPADASAPALPAPAPQNPPVAVRTPPAQTTTPPTNTAPTSTAPPTSVQPSNPAAPTTARQPAATGTNTRPTVTAEPSFTWGPDLFVGLGLAAAVSAGLLVARRRYRARYRPGSGDRDDLPVAPVVYQLRLAHLRAESDDDVDLDDGDGETEDAERLRRVPPPPALVVGEPTAGASERRGVLAPGLGVRDGREIALDLAVARGLGVVGAGTPAAIRALLVAVLTAATGHGPMSAAASVVVPAEDLTAVLGRAAAQAHLPRSLRVVVDLHEALDVLEAETLVRAAARDERRSWPPLVLVARPPQQHQRLQAVLDNGAPFGVTGLLLGQWQPGVSCYVREDGTVSATGPGLGEALRGARMFRLGEDDTAALLMLLRQTEPEPPAEGDAIIPPTTRPRIVPMRHGDDHLAGNLAPDGAVGLGRDGADRGGEVSAAEQASSVELEVTAATPAPADGELEILAPSRSAAPGARLRPPVAGRPRPAVSGEPEPGEVADTPAADRAPVSTAALVNDVAEDRAETARALITICVLGALRVRWQPDGDDEREITGALQPRTKELLVLLALHPGGTTRDTLVSALWGEDPPARPTNALHTALSRLRRDLIEATGGAVTDIASADNGHYRLDPATVDVDYWRFERAVAARRGAVTDAERIAAYRDVVSSYGGPLVEGLSKVEWLEPAREAIRRDALDAVSGLARALVEQDPQQTLDLLEVARAFDPHNELLYRDIMRLQERLGQLDAIPRTLTLLTTRLTEVGEQPTPQARGLAARLGGRRDHDPGDHPAGPGQPAARGQRGRSAAG